jgi:hypothetical protein
VSDHVNGVGGHPDVYLTEASFEVFFEFTKELLGLCCVGHINEHSGKLIAERLSLRRPKATDNLRLRGGSAELFTQVKNCVGH